MTVGVAGPGNAAPNGNASSTGASHAQGASAAEGSADANGGEASSGQASSHGGADAHGHGDEARSDNAGKAGGNSDNSGNSAGDKKADSATATAMSVKAPKKSSDSTKKSASKKADHSQGNASTVGAYDEPQPESNADKTDRGANAGNCETGPRHPYCSTRDGSASMNGNGDGKATGKPCAGCVGKADNKNPRGQGPGPRRDGNRGYECDGNNGIGKSNPAHTGCVDEGEHEECPDGDMNGAKPGCESTPECPDGDMNGAKPGCESPTGDVECPDGDMNGAKPGCEAPVTVECPDGDMNGAAKGCAPPVDEDEVLGVEADRGTPPGFVAQERPNRAPAAVAPASGILPSTGAGQFGLVMLAGLALLAAGGVLLARKRPQVQR